MALQSRSVRLRCHVLCTLIPGRTTKKNAHELLLGIAHLFTRFGIVPTVETGKDTTEPGIYELRELQIIEGRFKLENPEKSATLEAISAASTARSSYSAERFHRAIEKSRRGSSNEAIASTFAMPHDTVDGWLDRGSTPLSVGRLSALRQAFSELPDPAVQSRIVRDLHGSPRLALRIAQILSLEAYEEIMANGKLPEGANGEDEAILKHLLLS